MHIVAQTPRLIIREFIPADEEMYLNHFNDSLVALYLPRRSREERSIIFRNAVNYAADKRLGTWGMYDKTRGDFIGSCLLRLFSDIEPRQIELGYSLERRYWGLGIGTEMAKAMVSHGFTGDIDEIVAVTILENIGSQRVLEKAGFKRGDNFIRNGDELAFFKMTKPAL